MTMIQPLHGARPMVDPPTVSSSNTQTMPDEAGNLVSTGMECFTRQPSLTPQQIAQFASQFATDAQPYYNLWRECSDVVSSWRNSATTGVGTFPTQQGVAQWMRPRDVSVSMLQPLFRNVVARLSVETPSVGVVPSTEAADDIQKAQASEQAAKYLYRTTKMKAVLRKLIEWMAMHGSGGLLTFMDGDDVGAEAIAPEHIRAEPGVGDPDQSRFLGVVRITTKADLLAQFGDTPGAREAIEQAPPPKVSVMTNGRLGAREAPDRVEVLEAYTRSGHWFVLVGTSGTVLKCGETPGGCMPLQFVRYTRIPGQFFGMGMVEVAKDVQYAYSSVLNQMLRNARLMTNPKVLIERNSKVDENAFTSAVGEKVLYTGTKPDVWAPAGLPSYFQTLLPLLQSLMHDMTGIHTTSTGKRASGITSGRAIEALSANDMAQFQSTQDAIEEAVSEDMRCKLLYMKAYYPEEKVVREFDQYGRSIFNTLRATDMVDDPEVFLESGTLFSSEVKDKDQRTLDMLRLGLMGPDEGRKLLSFHLDPMAPVKTIADIEHARRMLGRIVAAPPGTPPDQPTFDIYPSDNLKVFDDVMGGFIRSPAYEDLSPDRQAAVHQAYLKVLAAMAPPTEGGGPPGGGAPGGAAPSNVPQMPGAPKGPSSSLLAGAADPSVETAEATDEYTQ